MRLSNGPSVTDMSMAAWPSIRPGRPRFACRRAASTSRGRRVKRRMTASMITISRPPLSSATRNCQPNRMKSTRPSSKTRLVEANSKMMALPRDAPLRKSVRATATAAYEQEEEAAPSPVAMAADLGESVPRARETRSFDTKASTTADNKEAQAPVATAPARTWRTPAAEHCRRGRVRTSPTLRRSVRWHR